MFLTASNMVHFLHGQGLFPGPAIVNGDFLVVESGRRNRNFKVFQRQAGGIFVKQVKTLDAASISTLRREAACYQLAKEDKNFAALAELMPAFIAYHPQRYCLLLELLPQAENVNEFHQRERRFPAEIGRLLGQGLGRYQQSLYAKPMPAAVMQHFPRLPPWILSLHNSTQMQVPAISGGAWQLLQAIRGAPQLGSSLDRLRQLWQYDSLIHGDMKWDNCLLLPGEEGHYRLKIIDWELVDYGDAAWDVGAILQAYLNNWIYSMPLQEAGSAAQMLAGAAYRLEEMFPALRAFWQAYCESTAVLPVHRYAYLLRCIEYAAARMLQTAYESLYYSPQMHAHGRMLLQVAQNILQAPQQAANSLFGFDPVSAREAK